MRGFLKVALGLGLLGMAASIVPACSSSDDSSGGSKGGTAGKGGTGGTSGKGGSGGSTGGSAGKGTGGSAGAVTCGGTACPTYSLGGGLVQLGACCSTNNKCGAEVSSDVGALIGVPGGCYESDQPGKVDCGCPPLIFDNPLKPGTNAQFNGCCTPDSKCGIYIDLTDQQGPKIGCQDASNLSDAGGTCTSGQETPPPGDAGVCGSGGAAGASGDGG